MDKFLLTMTAGVIIRRHQDHKNAEYVRLYSTNACREINWEKPPTSDTLSPSSSSSSRGSKRMMYNKDNKAKKKQQPYGRINSFDASFLHCCMSGMMSATLSTHCLLFIVCSCDSVWLWR